MSLSGGFASDVISGSDTARDTWQDGKGRECLFASIGKEMKQNAENFKRDFLLYAAEEILRFKVNDQVQARVGGRQEMDGGRKPQEKSIANSKREKSIANSKREKSIANSRQKRQEHSQRQAKKEQSQQHARKEHSQQQAARTRRSASPT